MSDDVTESFRSSLEDLKINSKPQISMLTMLAEDHEQFANDIVTVIEEQIKKVPVTRKLPIMYLIDSIIKNLSSTMYPQLFSQRIVPIFCQVFEEVDEKTRQAMYKLRQTWPDIIQNKQLYILDRKVQLIDPAWPITAKAPEHGVIHVNPKFLKPKEKEERSPQFSPVQSDSSLDEAYKDELYAKEKELQKLRLELELAETKAKLEQQKKQLEHATLKKVIDREPPPVIKLPPPNASPGTSVQSHLRDPRLDRDPRKNRDPRLKKHDRQEQEGVETDKQQGEVIETRAKIVPDVDRLGNLPPAGAKTSESSSSRMDLATLLNSFSEAAAKVAAEQVKVKSHGAQSEEHKPPSSLAQSKHFDRLSMSPDKSRPHVDRTPPRLAETHPEIKRADAENIRPKSNSPRNKEKKSEERDQKIEAKKRGSREKDIGKTQNQVKEESDARRNSQEAERSHERMGSRERDKKEKLDNKDKNKRDGRDNNRRESGEKERRDTHVSKDGRDKRNNQDEDLHHVRRGYRRRSPSDFKRNNFRNTRGNHARSQDSREREHFEPTLRRSDSHSNSRDRSPVERNTEQAATLQKEHVANPPYEVVSKAEDIDHRGVNTTHSKWEFDLPPVHAPPILDLVSAREDISDDEMKLDDEDNESPVTNNRENQSPLKESNIESKLYPVEEQETKADVKMELEEEETELPQITRGAEVSEDIDMRVQLPPVVVKTEDTFSAEMDSKNEESSSTDRQQANMKRPYPEPAPGLPKLEMRPYKIPKLGQKKVETKSKEEDISELFGEEDVDYRQQAMAKPIQVSPSNPSLTPPVPLNFKSPAQRRWSQFKESHPDDFAQDMERKRMRDAQMMSMASDDLDVDMRQKTSARPVSLPPSESHISIPKDLSIDNQEQILQRADQQLKEGSISHGDHQEIIRQLGQVYEIQKKRLNFDERPSRTLDLRDPRLRGSRDSKPSFPEDIDRRVPSLEESDVHRRGPFMSKLPESAISRDIPPDPANNSPRYRDRSEDFLMGFESHPGEDYDARHHMLPRQHDHRLDYERSRGHVDDFDGRSPQDKDMHQHRGIRDHDDRVLGGFSSVDARADRFREISSHDFDARQPRQDEDQRHNYPSGAFKKYNESLVQGPVRGDLPHDIRPHSIRDESLEDRQGRRNTPPLEIPFRPPAEDGTGLKPSGFSAPAPHIREPFFNQGPQAPPMQEENERPTVFPGSLSMPEPQRLPLPAPPGPRPVGPISIPAVPVSQGPLSQPRISDPMDDPRWSAMRGLLDNEGTEEVVIDGKPFELRMGTSRKLRISNKIIDVAVDLKERGIRIDGQLVYKLGEPIKEVPAMGRTLRLYYHGLPKPIWLDGQQHEMRMDAPPRHVIVDGVRRGFQIDGSDMMILVDRIEKGPYGGPPRKIKIAGVDHDIAFQAPPRRILIDNKSCELKLDSKIPFVVIDGKPHGIRFDGEPRTVFINDQPFTIPVDRAEKIRIGTRPTYIAFGGPAHEIIINGKWFEVKFDNVPKDIHLGNRHFSIRIPGPLPRVKILDELPPDFDTSCLMSSNQTLVATMPGQRSPGMGIPESRMITAVRPLNGQFASDLGALPRPPEGLHPQLRPPHPEKVLSSEQTLSSVMHLPSVGPEAHAQLPSATETSEGVLRPLGHLHPEGLRLNQHIPQAPLIPQGSQPMLQHSGSTPVLRQSNAMRQGPMPRAGIQRPNMIPFGTMNQNPRNMQQTQPINLLAQGIFNQMASNMMGSTLRALSQLSGVPTQPHVPPPHLANIPPLPPPPPIPQLPLLPQLGPRIPPEDHGVAMVTGMQGSLFVGHQTKPPSALPPGLMPPRPVVPAVPRLTVAQPLAPVSSGAGYQESLAPAAVPVTTSTAAAPSIAPITSLLPTSLNPTNNVPTTGLPPTSLNPSTDIVPTTSLLPTNLNPSIDINSLLSKLIQVGLIKEPPKAEEEKKAPVAEPEKVPEPDKESEKEEPIVLPVPEKRELIPDLTDFDTDRMKQVYKSVISQLHEGIQCHTCAARFNLSDHEKYRAHMDWHFRQNKLEQEMVKMAKNRKWFYSIPDWVQYEELEDTSEKSRSEIFEQMKSAEGQVPLSAQALSVRALEGKEFVKNPVASGIEGEDVCATCGDPFDQMWNEETEEWILKNTIKIDGKTYHPVCYEDAQEGSTPVTVPAQNPLEKQIQDMQQDHDDSITVPKVEIKSEIMEIEHSTSEHPIKEEPELLTMPIKTEIKMELEAEADQIGLPPVPSGKEVKVAGIAEVPEDKAMPVIPSTNVEIMSCTAPTLLSTIATTVVREVIPVSQEDPNSPWEMDSNPTPELSRTPTPEPTQSFTPAPSLSAESVGPLVPGLDSLFSEEPLPPPTPHTSSLTSTAADSSAELEIKKES